MPFVPLGQRRQPGCPGLGCFHPKGQLVHPMSFSMAAANVPGLHTAQSDAPSDPRVRPGMHGRHDDCPSAGCDLPAAHSRQPESPLDSENRPARQSKQPSCCVEGWCWPGAHIEQRELASALCDHPAGQSLHSDEDARFSWNCPGTHAAQLVAWPSVFDHRPEGQS